MTIPPPGPHGGDGAAVARALGLPLEEILDLSQSLNPVAPDPRPVIAAHLEALGHYPDATRAHEALASAMSIDGDRLLLTNGGSEAIALVSAEIGGYVNEPDFSLHPRGTGPLWRSNPHSPSGLLAGATERADVWDEAFYPLATGTWTRGDRDAVVVGSLTKLLACPGLRVGYLVGEPEFVARCRERQPLWSLNGLACAALPDLLAPLDLMAEATATHNLRTQLRALLETFGLHSLPSDANWLLVPRAGLRDALARHGVVVRDCHSFGLENTVRVAVPNLDGLTRLANALHELQSWLETTSAPEPTTSTTLKESRP